MHPIRNLTFQFSKLPNFVLCLRMPHSLFQKVFHCIFWSFVRNTNKCFFGYIKVLRSTAQQSIFFLSSNNTHTHTQIIVQQHQRYYCWFVCVCLCMLRVRDVWEHNMWTKDTARFKTPQHFERYSLAYTTTEKMHSCVCRWHHNMVVNNIACFHFIFQ